MKFRGNNYQNDCFSLHRNSHHLKTQIVIKLITIQ